MRASTGSADYGKPFKVQGVGDRLDVGGGIYDTSAT